VLVKYVQNQNYRENFFFGKSRDRGAGHQQYKGITEANLRFFEKIKARLREAFVATQV